MQLSKQRRNAESSPNSVRHLSLHSAMFTHRSMQWSRALWSCHPWDNLRHSRRQSAVKGVIGAVSGAGFLAPQAVKKRLATMTQRVTFSFSTP